MKFIFTCIILAFSSCVTLKSRYFWKIHDEALVNVPMDSIVLDNTYKLYERQVCRLTPARNFYNSHNPSITASVNRCNCEEIHSSKERLELQYLFFSKQKNIAIYITTIPPYIVKSGNELMYVYNKPSFNIDNFVNINFFNTFFFGKISGNDIRLQHMSFNKTDHWLFSLNKDESILTINDIIKTENNIELHSSPQSALSLPVKFYKKTDFQIGFNSNPSKTDFKVLRNRTIYIAKNFKSNPAIVLFRFNEEFSPGYSSLYFEYKRIEYSPNFLFNDDN